MLKQQQFKTSLLILGLWVAGGVLLLDQITKVLSTRYLSFSTSLSIIPGLDLTLSHNTGAAFSFLANASGWQRGFFITLAAVVSLIIIVWLMKLQKTQKMEGIGLSLILGGALGNLWDRLAHGYVIDFILLYYKEWTWPVFNIADTAICIGVVFLIFSIFRHSKLQTN